MTVPRRRSALMRLSIIAAMVFLYILMVKALDFHDESCNRVTSLARDGKKMEYAKKWLASRTRDGDFMKLVRENPIFDPVGSRLQNHIDWDWKYIGLSPRYGSVRFNVKDAGDHDLDATKIDSVSITIERSEVIIKLSKSEDLGLAWPPEELKKIERTDDDVFVHCDF